jgi:hypothetical protein
MLSAKHAPSLSLEAIRRAQERSLRMLQGGAGTLQSEFKSPLPPHELSFSHSAPEEIACAVRLIECLGAAAPPVSLSGHSGTALHVHVNVFNRMAAGPMLSALEVMAVWMAWVRFDSVTRRFARPWFWRNKFCAPLHATGAEFLYIDLAWEQGSSTLEGTGQAPGDVPRFIAAARANQPLEVHGDGMQSRCFADVRDVVRGIEQLLEVEAAQGGVFNIGSDRTIGIRALAELVIRRTASRSTIALQTYEAAFGAGFEDLRAREPDLTRIRGLIGFDATIALEQTIEDIGAWLDAVSHKEHAA